MITTEFAIVPPDFEGENWIPPEHRDIAQMRLTNEYHEEIGQWTDLAFAVDEPERVLDYEAELAVHGKLMPRPYQFSGSCVGVSWWRAYCNAIIGDILYRGDVEDVKLPFAFATYGVGRQLGGMRGKGEGSYGSAQARAGQEFGTLAIDHPGLPTPTITSKGWVKYSKSIELQWSFPTGWPIPREQLQPEAIKHKIGTATRLRSSADVVQAKAQGYGVTAASSFGTRGAKVTEGVLLAKWDGSWAHQMSIAGYWKHPKLGLIFPWDNQWDDTMGTCPELSKLNVNGSFWTRADVVDRVCQSGEVYAHTATGGFELKTIDWKNLGITYEN